MKRQYSGAQSGKTAMILNDEVEVSSNDSTGIYVKFDKIPTHV